MPVVEARRSQRPVLRRGLVVTIIVPAARVFRLIEYSRRARAQRLHGSETRPRCIDSGARRAVIGRSKQRRQMVELPAVALVACAPLDLVVH